MAKERLAIIMLGAPGSGKGTQGEFLEKYTGFKRYVMSGLIKDVLKPGHELYDSVFKKGILLDDCKIFNIFRNNFGSEDQVILDGIPRTLDQAYWLYGFLMKHNYSIELIFLNVDENLLIDRITSRYYCPKCHTLYNLRTKRPKVDGVCDYDGEKLIQRDDDKPEIFVERLKTFDKIKKVILDVYSGDIIELNGSQSPEAVHKEMMRKIILR